MKVQKLGEKRKAKEISRDKIIIRNGEPALNNNGGIIFRHHWKDQKGKGCFGQSHYQKLYRKL